MQRTIVTFDGGGVRGALSASILKTLLQDNPKLLDTVHVYAGTSTGAIIAAMLAFGIDASKILDIYSSHSQSIFKPNPLSALGAIQSKYDQNTLRKALESLFGTTTLGSLKKRLLIPTSNISIGETCIFDSHQLTHKKIPLVDVVLASSAAPTFFDPVEIHNQLHADGGLWAIDPTVSTILRLHETGTRFENMKILNIGTGRTALLYGKNTTDQKSWGMLGGWKGLKLLSLFDKLQNSSANQIVRILLRPHQILDLDVELSKTVDIDDTKSIPMLIELGDEYASIMRSKVQKFMEQPRKLPWYKKLFT